MTGAVNVVERTASTPRSPVPVTIRPGDNLQDAVRANPDGTTFLITRGVHRRQTVRPKDGMSFIGEPGAVLDGETVTQQAFIARGARNVTVRGLRITRYAPPGSGAAIEGHGSEKWTVEGNEIDNNSNGGERAYGVRVGTEWVLRRNSIHHNGWVGVQGYQCFDSLIEGNDIYANPPANFNDTVGEAANIKLFECGRITIRGNYVHDGIFRGIWVDTMAPDVTIEHNRVVNHGRAGIWYEVSYRGIIRNNYIENAGYQQTRLSNWLRGGGIEVSNSPDVSVSNNSVVNSLNGIIGLQAEAYSDGPYGKSQLRNFLVQGNTIVMPGGQTGITENIGNAEVFTSWNNRFIGNRFELLNNPTPFAWMGRNLDERQWQAYGQGTNDVFSR
jgi:parallel beta-helix repeat protein